MDVGRPNGSGGLVDVGEHLAEEALVLPGRYAEPRLGDEIAERLRRRQGVAAALQDGPDLLVQDLQRGVVADQVMQQLQQQPAAVLGIEAR